VTDGWNKATTVSHDQVLVEPAGNAAPTATFTATCTVLTCVMNSAGTVDPEGTAVRYSWNWGDGTAVSTTANPSHTYATPGSYTITLSAMDGWNKVGTTTRDVAMTEPVGNLAPNVTFTATCTALNCLVNSAGTADPEGTPVRFSYDFGDGTAVSTTANPSHLYAVQGTYTITLTALDGWGKSATATRTVTMTEPASNAAPTVVFTTACTALVCGTAVRGQLTRTVTRSAIPGTGVTAPQ
jgi:PKD repeat protein